MPAAALAAPEPLKPIDKVLILQRVSLFARVPADEQLVAGRGGARRDADRRARRCCSPPAPRRSIIVLEGEITVEGEGDAVVVRTGDALGVVETLRRRAARPHGAGDGPGRALRISHEDFFDLLGQRPDLLQHLFTTLFGARRADWALTTADIVPRPEAGPDVWREKVTT